MASLPEGVRMRFDHVSIAVRSIDRAFEFFKRYFPIRERNAKNPSEQVSGAFHWLDFHLGGFVIELIEDLPGQQGFVSRFIERHGEGMHHLSIEVNHLDPIVELLKADGVRVVDEQSFPDGAKTAFVSPRAAFGALIQFWEVPNYDNAHGDAPANGEARFDHVSIAVKDIARALEFFGRYFSGRIGRTPFLNRSGNFILANMEVAGLKLEFIQSPGGHVDDDFVGRFIERHGEGLHHISVDLKDFDRVLAKLKADGVRVVDEGTNFRGERRFFISPRSAFGVLVQIWDRT